MVIVLTVKQDHRVEWGHCDPTGVIQTPQFHFWIDQASHRLCETAGFGHSEMARDPRLKGFPAVSVGIELVHLPKYGDVISMTSRVAKIGNSSLRTEHRFELGGRLLATGFEVRVFASSPDGQPDRLKAVPIPEVIRDNLARARTVEFP